jgi:type IV pilus assembly protein PilM
MSMLARWNRLLNDPTPEYIFEISPAGIAWARPSEASLASFQPFEPDVLNVNPLKDNIARPDVFSRTVAQLLPSNGSRKQRRVALILPDYCARIAVLDFDALPSDPHEQQALVKFRIKKGLSTDVDSAVLSLSARQRPGSKKQDVVVAMMALEVAAHYEAPFRQAGAHPGFVTVSALAALGLPDDGPPATPMVIAKLAGRVLSVSVVHDGAIRLFRCLELDHGETEELVEVLFPTFAFVEDEWKLRPQVLRLCGFAGGGDELGDALGVRVTRVRSRFGSPGPYNAGLYGYLESGEGA